MNKIYTQNSKTDLRRLNDKNNIVLTKSVSNQKRYFYIYLATFFISIFLSLFVFATSANAQGYYSIDFSDTSTYETTCGSVNNAQWSVKNDSCMLYTPYYRMETNGCAYVTYDFSVNQSGAGTVDDLIYIQYQVNGGPWITDTIINGSMYNAVHDLSGTIHLCLGDVIRIRIIMKTESKSDFWAIKNGNGTLTGSFITYPVYPKPLPVELSSYKLFCTAKNTLVKWTTSTETKNEYFTVEKSSDARNWTVLEKVKGALNSNTPKSYSVEDRAVGTSKPMYYRLKQTDIDGVFKYYEILTSTCSGGNIEDFTLNNANQVLSLSFMAEQSEEVIIEIYDISGNRMMIKNDLSVEGENNYSFETSNLQSGIYLIALSHSGNRITKKVMVN